MFKTYQHVVDEAIMQVIMIACTLEDLVSLVDFSDSLPICISEKLHSRPWRNTSRLIQNHLDGRIVASLTWKQTPLT